MLFEMVKGGRETAVRFSGSRYFRPAAEHQPVDPMRVIGIDTESFKVAGVLTTTHIPVHTWAAGRVIDVEPGQSPLVQLLDNLMAEFGETETRPSRTRQRSKETRAKRLGHRDGRDGRRETVEPVIGVFYNAEYDLGRLIVEDAPMLRAVAMGEDSADVTVGPYQIEIVHMCPTGSAPSFEWMIRRDHKVLRLIGRDMWGYWKSGLDSTAAALAPLGVTAKIKLDDREAFDRDWLEMTEVEKNEIRVYCLQDSKTTREIYLATVELLMTIDRRVIRHDGTIPASAPGAAAKIAFAKAFDLHPGMEEWHRPPAWVSQLGLSAYAGGRVFCRVPGPVAGLTILDITSAYPDGLRWLPDPVTARYRRIRRGQYRQEDYRGLWGVLVIDGEGLDPDYPALRQHDMDHKRLRYVYGKFEGIAATIPEIVIGVESGRLRVDRIRDGVVIEGDYRTSFFRSYVETIFDLKNSSEKDSPMYLMAKLLLNALYGKLIEVREIIHAVAPEHENCPVPNWEEWDNSKFVKAARQAYISGGLRGLGEWTAGQILYRKPDAPPDVALVDVMCGTDYEAGHYFLPLYAASVTGFVSAKLGLAASCTQALQGDTDSVFTVDVSGMEDYHRLMEAAGYPHPREGLGSFQVDVADAAGVLVKTKMYSLKYVKGGKVKFKQAHHGVINFLPPDPLDGTPWKQLSRAERKERRQIALHDLLHQLHQDRAVSYQADSRPYRLKGAIRLGQIPGLFYQEARKIALFDDPNLVKSPEGFFTWRQLH